MTRSLTVALFLTATAAHAQRLPTPLRQATLESAPPVRQPITLRDASRNDRWLGLGPRDVRWSPNGSFIYFRWNVRPTSTDVPEQDPWFRTDREGRFAEPVASAGAVVIPGDNITWNAGRTRAAWSVGGNVFVWGPSTRRVASLDGVVSQLRWSSTGTAVDFMVGESLHRYDVEEGSLTTVATRVTVDRPARTPAADHLSAEAQALSSQLREKLRQGAARNALGRASRPMPIPAPTGSRVEEIQLSPDGLHLTFRLRTIASNRPPTRYMDYVDASGYSRALEARAKAGEPRDRYRLGIVAMVPGVAPESVVVRWVDGPTTAASGAASSSQQTIPHGPWWSPDGSRALVQFVGEHDKDLWITELSLGSGEVKVLTHDHDDAWIGGPPIQSNNTGPTLLEWLNDGSFVFASERGGWSHLHRMEPSGVIRQLTTGAWEVRGATLSPDRRTWLIQASEENAATDHLYTLPATGGTLTRITPGGGRNAGTWSPDGSQLAMLRSSSVELPDLFIMPSAGGAERRVTVSGTDAMLSRRLMTPQIVSITHPDGKPVYAALYKPARPNRERAALLHIHGGGYRQFAHLGWSVYGWSGHLGLLHHFLEQGYTVLDFDYRGSAGFGRDYRTDIAYSMGEKDVDGAVAAAKWLVKTQGVDSTRIGIYGVSYGGFMTLMSQFRYPGIFAAGVSRAPVTDWAHYSDGWTSRILGIPQVDSVAYRKSSPIYFAEGLKDHLLIEHGLVDDNVHFQDTARLVQRLLELEKDFEVMYYPMEPHVIETETGRYDQSRRAAAFFARWLLRR
jgi:dipeptidyl aminopeptidase/acylaminoacyl peptidase